MSAYEVEARFVGRFLKAADDSRDEAWRAIEIVQPGMLENAELERWFGHLSGRFAAGEPVIEEGEPLPSDRAYLDLSDMAVFSGDLVSLAEAVRGNWRARRQAGVLRSALRAAERAIPSANGAAKQVAEQTSMQLLDLFADGSDGGHARTWKEMLDAELAGMERTEDIGIPYPFPKLERAAGPIMPGDVAAVTGFSGSGKSLVAANLGRGLVQRGYPVIAFPTEMRQQWVARILAGHSGVRQFVAEKQQWYRHSSPDERDAYKAAIDEARGWPLEVVNRPTISPTEIVAATRVIRRRWADRPVIVIVDHMHRLNYGAEKADEAVGHATKLFKNFAGDEGLALILLYQPRKPDGLSNTYRPIAGYQIRGASMVWNEVDVHLSPFRAFVKVDPVRKTEWGTPAALYDHNGRPRMAPPPKPDKNETDVKLSDEHVFLKIDKRRVGGEGPTIWLNYHNPSGRIYEAQSVFEP